jgi:hypothetical protein
MADPMHEILNDYLDPEGGATITPDSLWVRWLLCSNPEAVDLSEAKYLLYEGDWSAGWTGEKLFILARREEFGLT